jgi:hypothetical protein
MFIMPKSLARFFRVFVNFRARPGWLASTLRSEPSQPGLAKKPSKTRRKNELTTLFEATTGFKVGNTHVKIAVGGSVFDKLKAEGKVPKDFQLTKAMRTGEEALPPEIQKAKDEFLRSAKATS